MTSFVIAGIVRGLRALFTPLGHDVDEPILDQADWLNDVEAGQDSFEPLALRIIGDAKGLRDARGGVGV